MQSSLRLTLVNTRRSCEAVTGCTRGLLASRFLANPSSSALSSLSSSPSSAPASASDSSSAPSSCARFAPALRASPPWCATSPSSTKRSSRGTLSPHARTLCGVNAAEINLHSTSARAGRAITQRAGHTAPGQESSDWAGRGLTYPCVGVRIERVAGVQRVVGGGSGGGIVHTSGPPH